MLNIRHFCVKGAPEYSSRLPPNTQRLRKSMFVACNQESRCMVYGRAITKNIFQSFGYR